MKYHFGFINSNVAKSILAAISPTLNYEAGHIASLPVISDERQNGNIIKLVDANIEFGKRTGILLKPRGILLLIRL